MAQSTVPVTITLTAKSGKLATATVDVPLTLELGTQVDGHVPVTVDHAAFRARLADATDAFARVAEA